MEQSYKSGQDEDIDSSEYVTIMLEELYAQGQSGSCVIKRSESGLWKLKQVERIKRIKF